MPPSSGSTALRLSDHMNWQPIKGFLSAAWDWCKRHWQLLVGFFGAVFLFLFFRKRGSDPEVVDHLATSHDQEVNAVDRSHEIEADLINRARAQHEASVSEIIGDSDRRTAALDEKARERTHQIVSEHGDDPDEITRRLGAATGIRVR